MYVLNLVIYPIKTFIVAWSAYYFKILKSFLPILLKICKIFDQLLLNFIQQSILWCTKFLHYLLLKSIFFLNIILFSQKFSKNLPNWQFQLICFQILWHWPLPISNFFAIIVTFYQLFLAVFKGTLSFFLKIPIN